MHAVSHIAKTKEATGRRILSLWFPTLSTDRIWRQRLGCAWRKDCCAFPPLLISRRDGNAERIAALDRRAEALKLRRSMGIADARAMHPSVEIVEADPQADRRLLEGLADWCDRYTPLVALDGADGLFLDIAGCSHLFGGEAALAQDMLRRFGEQGLEARVAIASTPGAAWAVARFHQEDTGVVPDGAEADWLTPMPPAALRLDAVLCRGLDSVGLRTIGAVMAAPRAPLARRFGKALILRLDQATGRIEEAVSPRLPAPELSAERRLAEPVMALEDIERLVLILAGALQQALEPREAGALGLRLLLFRIDGAVARLFVGLSRPARAPERIARLFHERLAVLGESLDAGCGFDLVRLEVAASAPLPARQTDFGEDHGEAETDLAQFVDRVHARLGRQAIRRPVAVASHLPERAVALRAFGEDTMALPRTAEAAADVERPLRLFDRPEPVEVMAEVPEGPPLHFNWRRARYRIIRAEGPERVGPEWWRAGLPHMERQDGEAEAIYEDRRREAAITKTAQLTRDYFRVEDAEGRRYWLFRQGLYGASEEAPRWFLHGVFV